MINFKDERINNLITLIVIFLVAGCVSVNDVLPSSISIGLWVFAFVLSVLRAKLVHRRTFIIGVLTLALMWISDVVNGEILSNTIKHSVAIITILFYVCSTDYDLAKKALVNVMAFLAAISLVMFSFCLIVPSLSNFLTFSVRNRTYANFGLFVYEVGMLRNCGFFWEPGAFQVFLNLALLIEISRKEPNKRRIGLLLLSVVTTFSTTGYIALALIFMLYLVKTENVDTKILFGVGGLIAVFCVFLVFKDQLTVADENGLVGKIIYFFDNKGYEYQSGMHLTTASIRFFSIIKPLECFFKHPVFGMGYQGLLTETFQFTRGAMSCTFVNWFAVYGFFFGLIMIIGYMNVARQSSTKNSMQFIVFLILLV